MSSFKPSVAAAIVIANMVGTGVFTSLGFQLVEIRSAPVLLALWAVGGLAALCGAMSYAELGAALPRSGGEYNFLSRIFHPAAGFISGWVSATVGFAAPTALAAMTFGSYLSAVFPALSPVWLATGLVIVLTVAHSTSHRGSGGTQRWLTWLKILLILGFSALALLSNDSGQQTAFVPASGDGALLFSGAFAVSLIYVNYAYSGWNAATYISGELERPQARQRRYRGRRRVELARGASGSARQRAIEPDPSTDPAPAPKPRTAAHLSQSPRKCPAAPARRQVRQGLRAAAEVAERVGRVHACVELEVRGDVVQGEQGGRPREGLLVVALRERAPRELEQREPLHGVQP